MGSVITEPSHHFETESTRLVELWQGKACRKEKMRDWVFLAGVGRPSISLRNRR